MPRIDVDVESHYKGDGIRQATVDVRQLNAEIANSGGRQSSQVPPDGARQSVVAGQVAAEIQQAGATAQAQLGITSSALTGINQTAGAASQASIGVINNIGAASGKASRELTSLRQQLAETERYANQIGGKPGASILEGVAPLRSQIAQMESQLISANSNSLQRIRPGEEIQAAQFRAGLEDQQRAGQGLSLRMKQDEQDRKYWAGVENDRAREEEAARKAGISSMVERSKFIEQDRKYWESQERQNAQRIRPGESLDASHVAALRENATREQRALRENEMSMQRASNMERRDMYDNRRDNMNQMMGGMILEQGGEKALSVVGDTLEEFGNAQLARIGTEALEGKNTNAVINQARLAAQNTYGADYRQVLGYENQLVNQGTERPEAQKLVKELSDINASMGGTSAIFQRIMYNLSQIESQGRLTGIDYRQFQMARLNLAPYLAKQLGVEQKDVRGEISAGNVTSEMVRKAIHEMGQDPRFKDRGEIISNTTLPGQREKTGEAWAETMEVAGEALAPAMGYLLDASKKLAEFLQAHPTLTGAGAGVLGAGGTAAALVGGAVVTKATLGILGQSMPALQNIPVLGRVFGGTANQRAATLQMTAAEMQLRAAQMQIGRGAIGAPGAIPGAGNISAYAPLGGASVPWYARAAGPAFSTGSGWMGLNGATLGSAAMGVGLGAGAGLGAREDYGSNVAGVGVGLSAAALSAFNPAAAALIGAAEAIRYGVNETYNKPIEAAAETGDGIDPAIVAANPGNSPAALRAKQQAYFDKAAQENQAGKDARGGFLGTGFDPFGIYAAAGQSHDESADNLLAQGASMNRQIKKAETQTRQQQHSAAWDALVKENTATNLARSGQDSGGISNPRTQVAGVTHNDDYSSTITLVHPRVQQMLGGLDEATR